MERDDYTYDSVNSEELVSHGLIAIAHMTADTYLPRMYIAATLPGLGVRGERFASVIRLWQKLNLIPKN